MLPNKIKKILKKQHYEIVGEDEHSAVQVCRTRSPVEQYFASD